eukprot:scaffold229415_cov29-Tisochrysis_lutea.AAC.3
MTKAAPGGGGGRPPKIGRPPAGCGGGIRTPCFALLRVLRHERTLGSAVVSAAAAGVVAQGAQVAGYAFR